MQVRKYSTTSQSCFVSHPYTLAIESLRARKKEAEEGRRKKEERESFFMKTPKKISKI